MFLAGGVTGCPDWQTNAARALPAGTDAYNPRRPGWPIDDPDATEAQIRWEHARLAVADLILFWFCAETTQPIALYELGAHAAGLRRPVAVGAHPDYPRRADVIHQLALTRPDMTVHDTIDRTCAEAGQLLMAAPARGGLGSRTRVAGLLHLGHPRSRHRALSPQPGHLRPQLRDLRVPAGPQRRDLRPQPRHLRVPLIP